MSPKRVPVIQRRAGQASRSWLIRNLLPLRSLSLSLSLALVVVFASPPTAAHSHPFHISTGQAELNANTNSLEVAVELNPTELERSIELRWNRDFSLDQTDAEAVIAQYAGEVFTVSKENQTLKLTWVGIELEISTGWLYFQFDGVNALDSLSVSNKFLVEFAQLGENEQLNTVTFRDRSQKQSLTFSSPTYRHELDGFTSHK